MQVCSNCGHRNRPGVVFCDNCGASLIGDSPLSTKNFNQNANAQSGDSNEIIASAGSDIFAQGTILRIEIEGAEPILLKPKPETVFGRRDPATGSMPDVDLTPFAGYRMGVSRKHALIRQGEGADRLDLWDLGSSNGTFLNGTRLNANRPYRLRDGDEIRFGQMVMHVYFQTKPPDTLPVTGQLTTPSGESAEKATNPPPVQTASLSDELNPKSPNLSTFTGTVSDNPNGQPSSEPKSSETTENKQP
jgi:pSer/pThr/pTyr-binding forkhead associated (FHA) protein